ncbi:glycosyltransferase [Pseudomonas sp. PDM15]|uniref:glycosyltransferase n=1 Tax=Pseudomonas sp. PDM15 TaxID=2769303 RepID=UPI001785B56F|nr:glycosyltransferase [Pseudomonas sp. PDM15]MBD9427213.1 glycosyltransferase [Pseudomonas sp. PDM15]
MKFSDFSSDLSIQAQATAPKAPKVTVILPTFARGYGPLQESIDSVLAQSFTDFELIIVDDGSKDGTAAILKEYMLRDPRVVVHSYQRNSGLPGLRVNQAALHAKGKYIAYQFDDDQWPEDSLDVRVEELDKHDKPTVVYGNARMEVALPDGSQQTRMLGGAFNYALLMNGNYIANNTVIHHKELFDVAGMYDPHIILRRYCDYDLWLRFAKHAEFVWIDHVISHVRANMDGSLGKDIPMFFTRYRKHIALNRNSALKPTTIAEYDVIDVSQFSHSLTDEEIIEYRRLEAIPFLTKFNDYCSESELLVAAGMRGKRLHLLTVKPDYSTSVDVTIGNFVQLPHQQAITSTYVKERDLEHVDLSKFDVAVLYRTVGDSGNAVVDGHSGRIPSVYLMDDNMLHFHEVGPEHIGLAPGMPKYKCLTHQITNADACIGYSDVIIDDLRKLNTRSIRLNTNIGQQHVLPKNYERSSRLRIAVLSGPVRKDVLRHLWPALESFAAQHSDTVEFHFWGINPEEFGRLECPVYFKPFTHSYESYLRNLHGSTFDVALVPLDHSTRAARSKSPVKILEAAVAGAICIFTDAPPYSQLPEECCIKVANTTASWEMALNSAYTLGEAGRTTMLENARALIEQQFTTESQFYDVLAAFESVRLHARVKKGTIVYAFHEPALGGATLHLIRHAALVASLGFKVVGLVPRNAKYANVFRDRWNMATGEAKLFEESWPSGYVPGLPLQREAEDQDHAAAARLAELMSQEQVRFVHFATWSPTISLLAEKLGVPCAASVHQYYEGAESSIEHFADAIHCSSLTHGAMWASMAISPVRRIVCPVDHEYFNSYKTNLARACVAGKPMRILVSGTFQPRKNQLAAIQAALQLNQAGYDVHMDLIGYTEFYQDYVAECRQIVEDNDLSEKFVFHGFIHDPKSFYDTADLLLISAIDESMPQTMLQAMAAGVPVVSTNVGGVGEIIKHRYSGFLCEDDSPVAMASAIEAYITLPAEQRTEMIERAQRAMRLLARPSYVRYELMELYNQAFVEWEKRKTPQSKGPARPMGKKNPIPTSEKITSNRFHAEASHVLQSLSSELVACRTSRATRILSIFRNNSSLWNEVSPLFEPLKSYSWENLRQARNANLILGEDLRALPYREYQMPLEVLNLNQIRLAVRPLLQATRGTVGVEIVSEHQEVLAQCLIPLTTVNPNTPTNFPMPYPIGKLGRNWLLRVFVRDADVPISLYEQSFHSSLKRTIKYSPFAQLQ